MRAHGHVAVDRVELGTAQGFADIGRLDAAGLLHAFKNHLRAVVGRAFVVGRQAVELGFPGGHKGFVAWRVDVHGVGNGADGVFQRVARAFDHEVQDQRVANQLLRRDQAKLLRLLGKRNRVAAGFCHPDSFHVGRLELGDVGREVFGAHWHIQAQRHGLALGFHGFLERFARVADPHVVGGQHGKRLFLEALGPLADHGHVHRIRVVGAEAARAAGVAGEFVGFAGHGKVGCVPALQVLRQRQ